MEQITVEQAQAVRASRALVIAKTKRIAKRGPAWVVPSSTHGGSYVVTTEVVDAGPPRWSCSCPDHEARQQPCKHIIAVEIVRHHTMPDGSTVTVTTNLRMTYPQNWPVYNRCQVNEKERFRVLLRDLCAGIGQPAQTMGRPRLPLRDLVFAAASKVYSTQSGRRAQTDLRAEAAQGLVEKAPSYNSVFRAIENPALTPLLQRLVEVSAAPLVGVESDFATDSSGFGTQTYRRWVDEKYGKEKSEAAWVKAHITCGVKTNIVTACVVAGEDSADSPQFKGLVSTTARRFRIAEMSADKAYLSRENVEAVVAVGATPYIPFKEGTGHGGTSHALWQKLFHFYSFHREAFLRHYHKRSNVETTFHMIKSKFGANVRSKDHVAQVNEAYLKVLCHNIVVVHQSIEELGVAGEFDLGAIGGAA